MSALSSSRFNNVFAALQLLGAAPGGVENEPVRRALETLGEAARGRSEPVAPLPGADRPTWSAFRRLERENQLLVDHAEMLACALGACPNCWGTIPDCEDCGGIGTPGAYNPDRKCFDHFVLPVMSLVMNRDRDAQDVPNPVSPRRDRNRPLSTSV
ncbi:hypothetical protein [Paracoccus salsus]|uniref:hypothetical protein n=1 Tax=Paracoccus salsus TaxID=2911061 RepID=UPI001F216670|nr:hypothetical protein [Paracoccus salsus]MCF3974362.1 hypothetical protein [Paracoccus salsus]